MPLKRNLLTPGPQAETKRRGKSNRINCRQEPKTLTSSNRGNKDNLGLVGNGVSELGKLIIDGHLHLT